METLRQTLRSLTIGPAVTHRNLTVFPLLGKEPGNRWYRTLEEALLAGSARVTEVSSAGSVPELMFVNEGPEPVLLVDGEELKGALSVQRLDQDERRARSTLPEGDPRVVEPEVPDLEIVEVPRLA